MDGWMDRLIDGSMDWWDLNVQTDEWMVVSRIGTIWMDGMNQFMDGRMNG